ncbi:hypothetical protein QL285_093266 [Trifolium repens]|nr:hypothetical protein QL285_093266 [Trifolium repens]
MSVDSTAASVNHAPPAPQNKGYQNDTLNPYLLYPNENPVALRSKHKLHFINRSFPRPSNDNHESIAWDECNTMIMSWLSNVVEPEISQSILWMDTDSLASARVSRERKGWFLSFDSQLPFAVFVGRLANPLSHEAFSGNRSSIPYCKSATGFPYLAIDKQVCCIFHEPLEDPECVLTLSFSSFPAFIR